MEDSQRLERDDEPGEQMRREQEQRARSRAPGASRRREIFLECRRYPKLPFNDALPRFYFEAP
jgi:hypothetical protein